MRRRRRELFRIHKFSRTYDRAQGKFTFNISYETAVPEPSERVVAVAEGFGLGLDESERFVLYDNCELRIGPTDVVYITGDSGSGKSVLLRAIKKDLGNEAIDMAKVRVDPHKPLIETVGRTVEEGLELLSRVGLNDAFLFLRPYAQLSDGQKYRYRMAKMIESGRRWWIADEFCATLDRDTAKIVAFNVQKVARALGRAVIVATTHTDLLEDLSPSVHVHKRFGREIQITYKPSESAGECSLVREMRLEEGSTADWKALAGFHYRSHRIAGVRKIFVLKRGDELCGVIVYSYPPPAAFGRRMVLPRMTIQELNKELTIVSRVVVHPKYRTIGLGAKLIRETLPLAGTPCVEMSAVMAKYNPFAEKAGMRRIAVQSGDRQAIKVNEVLQGMGFEPPLLTSNKYVTAKLQSLKPKDVQLLKDTFCKNAHPRYQKKVSDGALANTKAVRAVIQAADIEKLAELVKITGLLLQTKVYLFWRAREFD